MPAWNYYQNNAAAGPSKPASTNERRNGTSSMYTHWSQQHLEANPDAGLDLLRGLMQMSGSHDPVPLPPRSALRTNDHAETRTNDSTYSVLSNSTRNTDYTLGTPYSTISSASSSAYPFANTVPDIPLTSWMLPEAKDQVSAGTSTSYRNGFAISSSYTSTRTNVGRSSFDHPSPTNGHPLPSAMKQASRQSFPGTSTFSTATTQQNFRVPYTQASSFTAHITRDGHLPAAFNPQGRFGLEEGEIIDEAQFTDLPVSRTAAAPVRTETIWDFPVRPNDLQNRDRFAKPFVRHFQAQGKGKERETAIRHVATSIHVQDFEDESGSDQDMDDDEARDGYMRNCEPMVSNGKRTLGLKNLLGSPAPQSSLNPPSQSEQDAGSQTGRKERNRSRLRESPRYEPVSWTNQPESAPVDFDPDGVTDERCKHGERQRIAYVEIPPFCRKSPSHKKAFVFLDLPPLPNKPRAAAIVARQIVMGAVNARYESADEGEKHVESADDGEAEEVVIAGDRFLTKDDEPDGQQDVCHQCQKASRSPKMSCCNTEVECSLRFCAGCVEERYDFRFDAESRLFICPVCQGYCNCFPCLDKDKVVDKLHLAKLMDGSEEESLRILRKYKNVQKFLEAMGAAKAPPVPRTVIHVARVIRKTEDKQSRPIPQDVYNELMPPERMEVTYRSMLSLAGPIMWAFPKRSTKKRKNRHAAVRQEGDFDGLADESRSESDFDEHERRERKRARLHRKKSKPNQTAAPCPTAPFEFVVGTDGQVQLDADGYPVIKIIASPSAKKTPSKRNAKKQVTFSEELDPALGAWPGAENDDMPPPQRILSAESMQQNITAESMQQTVEYIQQQLDQQQRQKDNPEAFPDFQLDPVLQKLFDEDARSGKMARHIMEGGDIPWEEPPKESFDLDPPSSRTFAQAFVAATANQSFPHDTQHGSSNGQIFVEAAMNSPPGPFSSNANGDNQNFDNLVTKVQNFQNDSPNDELDAIFGVFTNATSEIQDGRDDGHEGHLDIDVEVGCMSSGES